MKRIIASFAIILLGSIAEAKDLLNRSMDSFYGVFFGFSTALDGRFSS